MKIAILLPLEEKDIRILEEFDKTGKIIDAPSLFLIALLMEFMKHGHKLFVFSISKSNAYTYIGTKLEIRTVKIGRHGNIRALVKFRPDVNALSNAIKKVDYDIIQAHWCYEYAAAALNTCKEKTIITMHDWPETIRNYLNNYYWRRRLPFGMENVYKGDRFVAVSPYIKECLELIGKDTLLIPNFIDNTRIIHNREEYDLDAPRIISICNGFNELKNTKNCIKMFAILRLHFPKATLIMAGSDHGPGQKAEQWSIENGLADGIIFKGRISSENVYIELSKCEIMISTSREESFGMPLIEAMASRCLAVGGKESGAVPWVLDYGRAGLLIDVENPEQIAEDIVAVLHNRGRFLQYIERGTEYVKENFLLDAVYNKYNRLYEGFLDDIRQG